MSTHEHNRRAWDRLVAQGDRFCRPASDDDFRQPLAWLDADGWLGPSVRGQRLLCLAAGGGKHGPLYAAAGAEVTVVDISAAQLALDRQIAAERGLSLKLVQTSMDDLDGLAAANFDVVIHPVSTCYVPDLRAVYRAVARVVRPGGLYISQHKQPVSLQAGSQPGPTGYAIETAYYHRDPLPPVVGSLHREPATLEFLHRWEDLLGGLCLAGFAIEDLKEPCHSQPGAESGSFGHRSQFVPPYVRIKARRTGQAGSIGQTGSLVLP